MDEKIRDIGIVTVFTSPGAQTAVGVAQVLTAEGFPILEVTFRNEAAVESIKAVAKQVPDAIVGAGTVLTEQQAESAIEAGAEFCVSPGFSQEVDAFCKKAGVDYFPGVSTATEIQTALMAGHTELKFFPAEASGGIPTMRALAAAFPAVRFMPTGGVNASNVGAYLSEPSVVACGGSWLAPRGAVKARDYEAIRTVARKTASAVYGVVVRDGDVSLGVADRERTRAYLDRMGGLLDIPFTTSP